MVEGRIIINPFFLVLIWAFIEFVHLLQMIWKIPPSFKKESKEKVVDTIPFPNLFPNFCFILFSISVFYQTLLILTDINLFNGIFQDYKFISILLFIVALFYLIWTFFYNPTIITLIIYCIYILYLIFCYIYIIPKESSYLSVLWLYLPLILGLISPILQYFNINLRLLQKINYSKYLLKKTKIWSSCHIFLFIVACILLALLYRGVIF